MTEPTGWTEPEGLWASRGKGRAVGVPQWAPPFLNARDVRMP
jgi:hypothetical protein